MGRLAGVELFKYSNCSPCLIYGLGLKFDSVNASDVKLIDQNPHCQFDSIWFAQPRRSGIKVLLQSEPKSKSESSNLDGDFVFSVQTLDLQCSYLRCSWDTLTFAHVETAG